MIETSLMSEPVMSQLGGLLFTLILSASVTWIAWQKGFYRLERSEDSSLSLRGSRVGMCFLLFIIMELLIAPAVTVVLLSLMGFETKDIYEGPHKEVLQGLFSLASIFAGALGVGLAFIELTSQEKKRVVGDTHHSVEDLKWGGIAWLVSYPFILVIAQFFAILILLNLHPPQVEQVAVKYLKGLISHPFLFSINILAVVTIVPLTEELLFRGFLQTWLRGRIGRRWAIILTSLLFALFHFSVSQGMTNVELLCALFVLSCFLGFIYERQRSILAPISLHACFNAISIFLILMT